MRGGWAGVRQVPGRRRWAGQNGVPTHPTHSLPATPLHSGGPPHPNLQEPAHASEGAAHSAPHAHVACPCVCPITPGTRHLLPRGVSVAPLPHSSLLAPGRCTCGCCAEGFSASPPQSSRRVLSMAGLPRRPPLTPAQFTEGLPHSGHCPQHWDRAGPAPLGACLGILLPLIVRLPLVWLFKYQLLPIRPPPKGHAQAPV